MAVRNLTDVFVLMRNNANHNRNIFNEQTITDRMALVESGEAMDMNRTALPPSWINVLEEIQFQISRIQKKLHDLSQQQQSFLSKPTFDESTDQEQHIEQLYQEVTKVSKGGRRLNTHTHTVWRRMCDPFVFVFCFRFRFVSQLFSIAQKLIHQIEDQSQDCNYNHEIKLSKNVTSSLCTTLQNLSFQFRNLQSSYLHSAYSPGKVVVFQERGLRVVIALCVCSSCSQRSSPEKREPTRFSITTTFSIRRRTRSSS